MNIFITGIAGFIGFHLAQHLRMRGDRVVGCDNFNPYYSPELKKQRARILAEQEIEVMDVDIQNLSKLEEIVQKFQITHVIHLAAQAGVRYSTINPQSYVDTNLDGFLQILELIRRHPKIPLIYASSSSVYGLNKKVPFAESDPTDSPSGLYGATKKSNELMANAYHHLYGISVTGLRFFTVYGPWGRPDMAYYSFTDAILRGDLIQIYNNGQMKRDFTYIDDVVRGTVAALDNSFPCEIFNLGNNQPEDILKLVQLLEQKLDKKARIELLPTQPGEMSMTYADISKSGRALGFNPQISLEQGLDQFLTWFLQKKETVCQLKKE
ncbi:MAG: GDP-mannose 4,6-dehydratase [Rhabdochlamydiaceae bacterium]